MADDPREVALAQAVEQITGCSSAYARYYAHTHARAHTFTDDQKAQIDAVYSLLYT